MLIEGTIACECCGQFVKIWQEDTNVNSELKRLKAYFSHTIDGEKCPGSFKVFDTSEIPTE